MKLYPRSKNKKKTNDISFNLSSLTSFQKKVLEVVKTIPYGEKKSYKWVAERMGNPRAARAVGQALKRNPYPEIIPCHRVIRSDGKLGGYSKGTQKKRKLLKKEEALE
ncbi:MGMT family protein [bacterium]|nr:MGMT family protein [bacterium]MCG2678238.1 MGMT family protein [bacterium]